jgi:hypothetical protein
MNRKASSNNNNNFRSYSKSKMNKFRKQRQTTKRELNKIWSNSSRFKTEKKCVNNFTKNNTIRWMKTMIKKSKMAKNIHKSSGAKKYALNLPTPFSNTSPTGTLKNKILIALKSTKIGTFTNRKCTKTKWNN